MWPPLPPDVWTRASRDALPFPLQAPGCRLFSRGRHALWHGLQSLSLRAGDVILAPAYHHGSEIEVMTRLGLECRFYGLGDRLEPDEAELDALLGPGVRALQIVHYLGHPQDAARWRRWSDERELLLIEDAAMAWLAETAEGPVGGHGDIAIYCLYKSFGLPDGAALVSRAQAGGPADGGGAQLRAVAGLHLAWLAQRLAVTPVPGAEDRTAAHVPYVPLLDFALGDVQSPIGTATRRLLPRVADPAAAARRRANARALIDGLGERVPAPFDAPPAGAAPFVLPVLTRDKAALIDRLARHGVEALDLWSHAHPRLDVDRFPGVAARRASTVALPVHQELRPDDLEQILAAIEDPPSRRPALRLEPIPDLAAAREPWQALASRSDNIFATWEWASTWWDHFGGDGALRLLLCRRGGVPVALLPLLLTCETGLRTLRFVGHGPADELGPVCASTDGPVAARALREALAGPLRPWDLFEGVHLPADEGWDALLGARVAEREASPVIDLPKRGDWDDFLATQSSSLRKQIRYQERRLAREHDLRYWLATDPDRLGEDFELLCRLHEQRWEPAESDALSGGRRAFLGDFARRALERGWLRLWFLELDGRPAAAWLGFRYRGVESYYQGGRDPAWDDRSVGAVIVAHTIRAAIGDGMREYRFLRGGEGYKSRLATRDPGVQTLVAAGSASGSAALAAIRARQAAGAARRALVRPGG